MGGVGRAVGGRLRSAAGKEKPPVLAHPGEISLGSELQNHETLGQE